MSIVYLNGEFLPIDQAKVSVLDRGFIFGDGVYELIPVYGRHLFRIEEHLQRLNNSLDAIRIPNPLSRNEWIESLNQLVEKNNGENLSVYLQISRGVAPRDHAIPENTTPTVFIMVNPLKKPSADTLANGISAITCEDYRWKNCHIKAISLLPNILLRQQAIDAGADEAILIRDGYATEGAASNVFIVDKGRILTPPRGPLLLPGITRDLVLELARDAGLPCEEANVSASQLNSASEVWLSSSTKEIGSVTQLDHRAVGDGKPGKMWRKMHSIYQRYIKQLESRKQ